MGKGWVFITVFVFSLFFTVSLYAAREEGDKRFYDGKVLTIVVSTKAGGGFDTYGRMTARFLKKYLPGATVIVKNVPGAGHIVGANEVYLSKPNGLTIGLGNYKGLIFAQLARWEGIKFDLAKFSWLANAASDPQVLIVGKDTPFRHFRDLKDSPRPIKMGAGGVGSAAYIYAVMIGKIAGINFKVVPGYSGNEAEMGMLRGELDGQVGAYDSLRPFIETQGARVLLVIGRTRPKELMGIPMIGELERPETKGLINLMIATAELGRPLAAPPNLPPVRLKILREALAKTFHDPELLDYARRLKVSITYTSGEDTQKLFTDALHQSPEVIKMVKEMVKIE